ncbi:MAG: SMC-Scp complex subunit ScpB [Thermoanaerobaculales bacterium]|jgi:segregation and condensation protein B|nr:SMC-Scp complex subunit ScpB [Thermoanaerobaculales bacterium]
MDRAELTAALEAMLVTAGAPLSAAAAAEALGEPTLGAAEVGEVLEAIARAWDREDSGLRAEKVADGWRCVTPAQLDSYLRALHGVTARQRLSQPALEVLAIVAHRQPVTLPEINFIRGANSASVLRTLLERRLLRLAGRKKVVGKPFLYRTSKEFLIHFGLERAEDLPDPEELLKEESAAID